MPPGGNVLLAEKCIVAKDFPELCSSIDFKQIIEREFFLPKFTYLSVKIIFIWTILKSLLTLLQHCLCFMFCFFGHEGCGVLVFQPEIKLAPLALDDEVLTTGPPGKSP